MRFDFNGMAALQRIDVDPLTQIGFARCRRERWDDRCFVGR